MMNDEQIGVMAEAFHNLWCCWASSIVAEEKNMSEERVTRWKALWIPYESLPESEKARIINTVRSAFTGLVLVE